MNFLSFPVEHTGQNKYKQVEQGKSHVIGLTGTFFLHFLED